MKLMPGTQEIAEALDALGVPRGLITRNVQSSVAHFHATVFSPPPFNPALARCFTPYKPAPDSLQHICSTWGIEPAHVVMIGDSAKDDIVCGNRYVTTQCTSHRQCFCFQNETKCIFGHFDPENICLVMKITNFRGDLTDISAKKEALHTVSCNFPTCRLCDSECFVLVCMNSCVQV